VRFGLLGPLRDLHRQILDHAVPRQAVTPGEPAAIAPIALLRRGAELAALTDLLTTALDGSGRIVAMVGDAGIGKTGLAAAVGARATGVPVVWGRCPDRGQAPPFWLWSQVVRELVALPQAGESGVAAALTVFTDRSATLDDHNPSARFHTYEAVAALINAVARPAGLVIVLDDLHAADRDSLLLLRFLAAGFYGADLTVALPAVT